MGGRIEPHNMTKRSLFLCLGLLLVGLLLLASCPNPLNPLKKLIESSGITVKIQGKTISDVCNLGRVKQGETYSLDVTILNTGNSDLKLTEDPPVASDNIKFIISTQPAKVVKVRGSTTFTVTLDTTAVFDNETKAKLRIINNSQKDDFSFDLTAFVDATAPSVATWFPVGTNVPTNAVLSARFSEDIDPATITNASFKVAKFVDLLNPVSASVKYDAATKTANLDPTSNLAANTDYQAELTSSITDLVGLPLTPYSWIFTTGAGADVTPPVVVSTSPQASATGVATSATVSATFDEALDPTTIISPSTSFRLFKSGAEVPGAVTYNNTTKTATFDPTSDLELGTVYEARLSVGIKDAGGNATTAPYIWSFTTTQGAVAPTVVARYPVPNASGVATNANVSAEFSEAMDPATVTTSTFTLKLMNDPYTAVVGAVSYNAASKTAIFDPNSDLSPDTFYTATLTTGVKDAGGTPLGSQVAWNFKTALAPDTDPPDVSVISPIDTETNVLLAANITATFDESMDPATINGTTFQLLQGTTPVVGTVSYSESTKTATFDPTNLLDVTTVYTAKITTGAKDAAGNGLLSDRVWSFTTEAGTSPPIVVSVVPANGAADIDVSTTITVEFSKMMNAATITTDTFIVSISGTPVTGTVSYNSTTRKATFTPSSALSNETSYKVECTTGIQDIGTNALTYFSSLFTTVAANKWDSMKWDIGKWGP